MQMASNKRVDDEMQAKLKRRQRSHNLYIRDSGVISSVGSSRRCQEASEVFGGEHVFHESTFVPNILEDSCVHLSRLIQPIFQFLARRLENSVDVNDCFLNQLASTFAEIVRSRPQKLIEYLL